MTFTEWRRLIAAHEQLRVAITEQRPATPCRECGHFVDATLRCEWHKIEPVPQKGLEQGCDDFSEVPF